MCNNVVAAFMYSKIVSATAIVVTVCSVVQTVKGGWCTLCGMLWLRNRVVYTFRIPVLREEGFSKKDKRITMAQYENGLRKDSFVNWTQ